MKCPNDPTVQSEIEWTNTTEKDDRRSSFFASEFSAGCFAGCTASLVGQPLDTIRIRLQTQPRSVFTGALDAAAKTLGKEDVRGFFRGAMPPLLGMGPKNAVGFATKGFIVRVLEGRDSPSISDAMHSRRSAAIGNVLIAGAAAGLAQCVVIVPTDRIKIQLQVQGRAMCGTSAVSTSLGAVRRCVATLVQKEGIRVGLYRGLWPTLLRQVPSGAVYFSSFEAFKRRLGDSGLATGVAGGCAGCVGYLVTYPLDVLKSSIMAASPGTSSVSCSMVSVARRLQAENGRQWMWRGLGPTLARGFVINAVNFAVFEWVMNTP